MTTDPYILYRSGKVDERLSRVAPSEIASLVFFNMWAAKQPPYRDLRRGDRVFAMRRSDRHLIADMRVAHVVRTRYQSVEDAREQLLKAFEKGPDDYWMPPKPGADGWLISFNFDVVQSLDVPTGLFDLRSLGAMNGWVMWHQLPAEVIAAIGRRVPGEPSKWLATAPCPHIGRIADALDPEFPTPY